MKYILPFLVCVLVGVGIGWHFGYTRASARQGQLLMQESEDDDGVAAAHAIVAVRLIESGKTQKSVQFLSGPIARYYYLYGIHAGTNEDRLKLLAQIEQLVSTNEVVADEITNQMVNYGIHGKLPDYWRPKQ